MFAVPGSVPLGYQLSRKAAQQVARNWWMLLLSGIVLVVAGFLIFSIDWTVRDLATFIGALFIFQGLAEALTTGIDARVRQANVIAGLLSIAAGVLIIVWPSPGLVAVAIVLAFEVKRLPDYVDRTFATPATNGAAREPKTTPAPARS